MKPIVEALLVSAVVTAVVTVAAATLPDKHVASAVGFIFLAATWLLVWRGDDATVERYGLTFGGLVIPGRLDLKRAFGSGARALAWALGLAAITFIPFYLGWRQWWRPHGHFTFAFMPGGTAGEIFGQLLIIALPEEAFYRGYLQTRLGDAFPQRWRFLGAEVGPAILFTSAIFALGHLATIHNPARLAVFFPALLFGWLRARTGGVGAGIAFHALCNVFSEVLGKGYGVY
ncbi:MAG: myxosortase MrtC [Polyangiaceae bacterium]